MHRNAPGWIALAALVTLACPRALTAGGDGTAERPEELEALEDGWVAALLAAAPERFGPVLEDPAAHRLQVLVTEVREGADGAAELVRHGYRVDAEYFYPASSIKLCAALAALEELNELRLTGYEALDERTPLVYHPLFGDEELEREDPTNLDGGAITLEHELRKLFLVSDNTAYNRLYELVGRDMLNVRMHDAGFASVRAVHRLSETRTEEQNGLSPRIDLLLGEEPLVIPERKSELALEMPELPGLEVGTGWHWEGEYVEGQVSFRGKNRVSLFDLQAILLRLFGYAAAPDGARELDLTPEQLELVRAAMTELPSQSENPVYDPLEVPDDYVKYLRPGLARVLPVERLEIANKVGRAYGFTIENAFVRDLESGRAFFVAAVLYTNANGVLNDGVYEYEAVADPFFADLGEALGRRLLLPEED